MLFYYGYKTLIGLFILFFTLVVVTLILMCIDGIKNGFKEDKEESPNQKLRSENTYMKLLSSFSLTLLVIVGLVVFYQGKIADIRNNFIENNIFVEDVLELDKVVEKGSGRWETYKIVTKKGEFLVEVDSVLKEDLTFDYKYKEVSN